MKIIHLQKRQLVSPWLDKAEAAAFLSVSVDTFRTLNKRLPCPHGGPDTCAKYHADVLSAWWNKLSEMDHKGDAQNETTQNTD